MKAVKLSLAAALVASSAFAVENVKVDGQVKLWYQTTDQSGTGATANDGLFKKTGASGDLFAKVKVSGDLTKKAGFGFAMYALTASGLENNLVTTEAASTNPTGVGANSNPYWLGEAYFNYKAGNSVVQIGRQTLDTPLAYTETWNVAPNTFEAMVVLNNDLPKTTLVGAFVSRGNGTNATSGILNTNGGTVSTDATFNTLGTTVAGSPQGAYAVGAVTTAVDNVTAQGWYYDIADAAKAYWLQADAKLPMNVGLGVQYANLEAAGAVKTAISATDYRTAAYAVQLSTEVAGVNLAAAYSDVSKGTLAAANVATGGKKSKLYTASILSDGTIAAQPDVKSYKVSASTKVAGLALGASYSGHEVGDNANGYSITGYSIVTANRPAAGKTYDVTEMDLSVSTKVDDINLAVYYVKQENKNNALDTQAVRVIASIDF